MTVPAQTKYVNIVDHIQALVNLLIHDQDGVSQFFQFDDLLIDRVHQDGHQPYRGLIDQDGAGMCHGETGNLKGALLAAGKSAGHHPALIL